MASGLTGTYLFPYPLQTDAVDVAADVQALAQGIETTMLLKAPLFSPTFTGVPLSTTPADADNSTKIATTAFVKNQSYLTTTTAASTYLTIATAGTTYAPLASPSLTGTPLAPTATGGTNTTQIATTAFVTAGINTHSGLSTGVHGVSGSVVGTTGSQTLESKTLTSPTINTPTLSGGSFTSTYLIAPEEKWNVSATAVTTTTTVDYLTAQNWYYTTTSTAGACTINIRGNSGTTLSSLLAVGDSVTFTFAIATGATTPAYFNAAQVDGTITGVTVRWQYATTPTSGTTSGTDMYSFTVLKTAATPTYTVFASVAKW